MLLNILGNAVKFTERGYVHLVVRGESVSKRLQLEFEIADSGRGIKKEDMGALFKEFTQVDTKKNRSVEGTGLGLSITRRLCVMMGGEIKVSSIYGSGSTFILRVLQEIADPTPLAAVVETENIRVVVFEKSPLVQSSLASTIANLGVACDVCATREGLYRLLQEYGYNYVFISTTTYRELEGEKLPGGVSIVLIADYDHVIRESNVLVLRKPVTCIQIANILNDATNGFSAHDDRNAEEFFAPEARVLIVDDNVTNLKVANGLIGAYGMKIDTALSGEEALIKLKQFEYDMVFMDHMMPEMDGVETTHEICKLEGEYFKNLPIVALTANAVSGARELFLKEGMNDFLSKPINSKKLNSILEKYIPRGKRVSVLNPPAAETKAEEFTIAGVNMRKGMINCGGIRDSYLSVLSIFHSDGTNKPEELTEMFQAEDIGGFTILIHALKSACAQIGAENVSELAAKPKGNDDLLSVRLAALAEFLEVADASGIDSILEELLRYSWDTATSRRLKEIKKCADVFDFDGALKFLQGA